MQYHYWKMDGTGNDFVILDGRENDYALSAEQVRMLSARSNAETGGCDQVIVLGESDEADVFMRIYNADGGEVDACGNATRCVGWLMGKETGNEDVVIETEADILFALPDMGEKIVAVDMGEPGLDWQDIPLSGQMDTLNLRINIGPLSNPVAVSMGNPHMVFFVDDVDAVDFVTHGLGRSLEHHPLFPERANVGAAQVLDRNTIKLRVFERGTGETQACGTGACAAVVAAVRRNLTDRAVTVKTRGGDLSVTWDEEENSVVMSGAVQLQKEGMVEL